MASFSLNGTSSTARTLNNLEDGLIGANGFLNVLTGDAITGTASMEIYTAGGIVAADGEAIDGSGTGIARLHVAQSGYVFGNNAFQISGSSFRTVYVQNAGTMQGSAEALDFNTDVFARVYNSGVIGSAETYAIISSAASNGLYLNNTGTIQGQSGVGSFSTSSNVIFNSGEILASSGLSSAISLGDGTDNVVNVGTISGRILLSAGNDLFNGINGLQEYVSAGSGDDTIYASAASQEQLFGSSGNDTIFGNGGGDTFFGGADSDIMRGGKEADEFDGGTGTDWVYYQTSDAGVEIDLIGGFGFSGHAEGDTLTNVERVWGSAFRDILNADNNANYLVGGSGNDEMRGYAGNDLMRGDNGADVMNGGSGFDTLLYAASNAGVNVNLTTGSASGGHATGDLFFNFERLTGSLHGDTLTGNAAGNQLTGLDGNDTIRGYLGNDLMNGGAGIDTFVFDNNSGQDIIVDFTNDVDRLDLSVYGYASAAQVLANTSVSGNDVYITYDANDVIRLVGFAPNVGDLSDDLIL